MPATWRKLLLRRLNTVKTNRGNRTEGHCNPNQVVRLREEMAYILKETTIVSRWMCLGCLSEQKKRGEERSSSFHVSCLATLAPIANTILDKEAGQFTHLLLGGDYSKNWISALRKTSAAGVPRICPFTAYEASTVS